MNAEHSNLERKGARRRKTPSAERLSKLLKQHYHELAMAAKDGAFVVWASICAPVEILAGFENVVVAIPENHAAMSASKGAGVPLAKKAENLGYSMDICSYARIDLGTEFGGACDSPVGGLPKPNLLLSDTNNCSLLVKWFDVYHRKLGTPHAIIDAPFCYEPQAPADTSFLVGQFQNLIAKMEQLTGQECDIEKVRDAVKNMNEATRYWKEYLQCAEHEPSGLTAFDTFAQMAPFVVMRTQPDIVEHYKLLARETLENMENGIFPVPNERYRLLWDNIAPWHQLRSMSTRLAAMDANLVHATYTSCIGTIEGGFEHYPYEGNTDPLEYLARIQNFSVCPYGLELRFKAMRQIIEKMSIDAVIFASNRSCKVYSLMQLDLKEKISETLGIPTILIDVDHADVRKYNEEGVFLRIESLLEMLDAGRQG
ncbi:2-hydroxyacyl-CoA dehydratase [Candidatus Bathyarchaeota archaeon]|nr:2-hydroxyacyl-CoA dehydratase [Candidatus Bathyarchaeota archaeon]